MSKTENKSNVRSLSVFLWVPNIIGYARIVLVLSFLITALHHSIASFVIIFATGMLDGLDGYCARRFNQLSKMGAMLDYAIDRATVAAIFLILAMLYPSIWWFFCFLMMLDIFSHISQLYSTVFTRLENHKNVGHLQRGLLKAYYTKRIVLYYACVSHDFWLGCLYLYSFYQKPWIFYASLIFLPGFIFKTIVHFLQIISVFRLAAEME